MKSKFLILGMLLGLISFAQEKSTNIKHLDFPNSQRQMMKSAFFELPNSDKVADYIKDNMIQSQGFDIIKTHEASSPSAHYYSYNLTKNGFDVHGSGFKAIINKSNNNVLITSTIPVSNFDLNIGFTDNSTSLLSNYNAEDIVKTESEYKWYLKEDQYVLMNSIEILLKDGTHQNIVYDHNEVFYERDLNIHHHQAGPDSLATMKVFNPDPLTEAMVPYGGIYVDMNDSNEAVLNPLRVEKKQRTKYSSGVFSLENDHVIISEFSTPVYSVVSSSNGVFDFSRSHHGFEQVNAFYHISNYQDYMKSLGFNLVNYQINVDAQALNGADNSQFNYGFTPPRLFFGEGGIDDAEDADVVLHEYGHAISHSANGTSNFGVERETLDEAFGDYIAASFSKNINTYHWQKVYSWDGNTPTWQGRSAVNSLNKYYPNLVFTNIYQHTDLWVSALMEIWDNLGSVTTDKLVIESVYSYYQGMKFPDAAMAVVQADSLQNNGNNFFVIWNAFHSRGILPSHPASLNEINKPTVQLYGSYNFSFGGTATIVADNELNGIVSMYNALGKLIWEKEIIGQDKVEIESTALKSGLYILVYKNEENLTKSFKLIKN